MTEELSLQETIKKFTKRQKTQQIKIAKLIRTARTHSSAGPHNPKTTTEPFKVIFMF